MWVGRWLVFWSHFRWTVGESGDAVNLQAISFVFFLPLVFRFSLIPP
jgi:hypothetical protein